MIELSDFQLWATFAIIVAVIVGFATERLSIELTALSGITALLLFFHFLPVAGPDGTNLLGPDQLLAGFANPVLFTIMSLLIIGKGLIQTGALEYPARIISVVGRRHPQLALVLILLIAAFLSAFLNNTPVVVIFIPLVAAVAVRIGYAFSRVMMPLSFITILGGSTTLIGSSANLVAGVSATKAGLPEIGIFDFFIPGSLMAIIGALYVIFILPSILRPRSPANDFESESSGKQYLLDVELEPDHSWIGARAVAGLFPDLKNITVRMIHRAGHTLMRPFDDIELQRGDRISVLATRRTLVESLENHDWVHTKDIAKAAPVIDDGADTEDGGRNSQPLTMGEAMVAPGSGLRGMTLSDANSLIKGGYRFLGIQRRKRMLRRSLAQIPILSGDVLLLIGHTQDVRNLRRNPDLLVLEWSIEELRRARHSRLALLILAATVIVASSGVIPILIAAIAGAIAMIGTGCLSLKQAAKALDPRIYVIIGAAFGLAEALQATGGAELIAHAVAGQFAPYGPLALLSALFLLTAILTNFLSNQATAALIVPIAVSAANQMGTDPIPFVHGTIIALNCSFATPMAYQTNLMVMGPGGYRFKDFVIGGVPLIITIWIAFSVFASFYYRF